MLQSIQQHKELLLKTENYTPPNVNIATVEKSRAKKNKAQSRYTFMWKLLTVEK